MRRYSIIPPIKENVSFTTKHRTSFVPKIERKDNDQFIRTRAGDRLDAIAHEFYEDVSLWWIIAAANHLGKGSLAIPPGTKLRIPQDITTIVNDYENFNTSRR